MSINSTEFIIIFFMLGVFLGCLISFVIVKLTLISKLKKFNEALKEIQKKNVTAHKTKVPQEKKSAASVFLKHLNRIEGDLTKKKTSGFSNYLRSLNQLLSDNGIDKID